MPESTPLHVTFACAAGKALVVCAAVCLRLSFKSRVFAAACPGAFRFLDRAAAPPLVSHHQ